MSEIETAEDLLFFKLKDLITEQSEGEWTDQQIIIDAHHFANHLRPLLAARPVSHGEGFSALQASPSVPICAGDIARVIFPTAFEKRNDENPASKEARREALAKACAILAMFTKRGPVADTATEDALRAEDWFHDSDMGAR
jgi:hypothetical protein